MEIYFNMYKIKYSILNDLLNMENNLDYRKPINLFINLNPVLKHMTDDKCIDYLKMNNPIKHIEFISNVINLAAHYKGFFIKNGINLNIYLYIQHPFESADQINRKYNGEYRMYSEYKFTNETVVPLTNIVNNTIPNIENIVSYIPNVYFIKSNNIESSLIPMIIDNDNSIIITDDLYEFQYVNYGYHILLPKRSKSILLNNDNIMNYISSTNEIKTKNINSTFLPFILSIYGNKYRNIYKIKGFGLKTIFKSLEKAITEGLITYKTSNIELLLGVIKQSLRKEVRNNFYCTDINYQYNNLTSIDIDNVKSQITDKYNPSALNIVNNKYFELYPLQLIELTSEVVETKKIKF